MEIFDIGATDIEPISLKIDDITLDPPLPSSSSSGVLGPGLELLMNDKKRASSQNVKMSLGDVDDLEAELNNLSGIAASGSIFTNSTAPNTPGGNTNTQSGGDSGGFFSDTTKSFSNLFGFGSSPAPQSVKLEPTDSKLGTATKDTFTQGRTWDGFSKMNEIPSTESNVKMNERDKRRKKRAMLKKLEDWRASGKISQSTPHFTMDSPYEEIEDEYETAIEDKRKKESMKLQGWWFMTAINSMEYMNAMFNPFDLNLDGWGEQVTEDLEKGEYDEIFAELHEKYKGGKLSPELSLLLRIGFSAAVVNFSNKALSSATPGFNDVIKQSPELMKMFTDATVKSMSESSPGFAFANTMLNKPDQVNTSFGPPPKAVDTRPPSRMQFTMPPDPASNRPDISVARGQNQGIELNGYADANKPQAPINTPKPESFHSNARPEMKGPSTDIDHIFAGLKTKTVNMSEQAHAQAQTPVYSANIDVEDDSVLSISSLRDLQNGKAPKRSSGRRNKSDRSTNVLSLDI